jgi:hypothetical protein
MTTPQESVPTTPHLPVQVEVVVWHVCVGGVAPLLTQTCPLAHGAPHVIVAPEHVV